MQLSRKHVIHTTLAIGLLIPMSQAVAKPPFPVPRSPNATTIRPLDDFLARQGTFCIDQNFNVGYETQIVDGNFMGNCATGAPPLLFVPPIANFIGPNDPNKQRSGSVDYAGLANRWAGGAFGTTFAGKVIERPLADGRALVEVLLRTDNALTWVADGFDAFNGPLLFGNRGPEAAAGAEAALGSSQLQVKFINTAPGAPLPDLIQLFVFPEAGQEPLFFGLRNRAKGPLRDAFGVADGTPGLATGVQSGLLGNPQCGAGGPSAVADCFPAERIELHVVGQ